MSIIDNSKRRLITVDFDGTICDFAFPGIGALKPGVKEALTLFRELGYLILIYSCRSCHWHYDIFGGSAEVPVSERPTVIAMREYLDLHEIPYDEIDDGSRGKPMADFMIDDKGIRYDNNWPQIAKFIHKNTVREAA